MKLNLGTLDQKIRIGLAAVIAAVLLFANVDGTLMIILGAVAVILLLTSLLHFCPLYSVCRISTKKQS
jgi:hypothetical protein